MSDPLARMEALAEAWGPRDRRSIFARAYGTMTASMLVAIEDGEFADDTWVELLLHRFADYYFDAVDAYDDGAGRCPVIWCQAFDACRDEALHPLRVLFLGINAHINYDLAFTLADVLDTWSEMDEDTRRLRLLDHEKVNEVIARTVDVVQTDVVEPLAPELGVVDRFLGPVDEWAFSSLIASWRHDTWVDAVALLESSPGTRPGITTRIEQRAFAVAEQVMTLGPN